MKPLCKPPLCKYTLLSSEFWTLKYFFQFLEQKCLSTDLQSSYTEKPGKKIKIKTGNEANNNPDNPGGGGGRRKHDYKVDDSVLELLSTHLANTDNQLHDRHTGGRNKRSPHSPLQYNVISAISV